MNRALRATLGALVLSPVALAACSAGQVTQTATQERDKTGPTAQVGDITLRQIQLAYPSGGAYEEGDDAELQMAIVNRGGDDTLTEISGEDFDEIRITGGGTAAGAGSTSGSGGSSGESSSGSSSRGEIDIPGDSALFLGEEGPTVALVDLAEPLTAGQSIELTLTFETAGEVTVQAQVATPDRERPRGEAFDFHEEEGAGSGEAAHGASTESGG